MFEPVDVLVAVVVGEVIAREDVVDRYEAVPDEAAVPADVREFVVYIGRVCWRRWVFDLLAVVGKYSQPSDDVFIEDEQKLRAVDVASIFVRRVFEVTEDFLS